MIQQFHLCVCVHIYICKANKNRISNWYLHPHVYYIIHNRQDIETTQVVIYRCMDKEDYSVMRKEEILPFETTWMKLKDIMLSDRERQILCDITYMQNLKKKKTNQTHRNRE